MTTILHITPHIGGGVGKALTNIVKELEKSNSEFEHKIVCLEKPINNTDTPNTIVEPNLRYLSKLMKESDIVQLEYWNHPSLFLYLCCSYIPHIRLVTWCHNSGLYTPIIPEQLIQQSHLCLFTSYYSHKQYNNSKYNTEVVYSSGGFEDFPEPSEEEKNELSAGYLGSMNFSKFHPHFINYISKVDIPDFQVKMIGKPVNKEILLNLCNKIGKPNLLNFTGYTNNLIEELKSINVLIYLLNPKHYGTTENALLETMSMGIVPIVLNNPAEKCIIENYKTGIIVESIIEFKEAIEWLHENPEYRKKIGKQASKHVRTKFSLRKTVDSLNAYYERILLTQKRKIDFTKIFGETPEQWFLSTLDKDDRNIFKNNGNIQLENMNNLYHIYEETKGSIFHFSKYFPNNQKIKTWKNNLNNIRNSIPSNCSILM